VARLPRPRAPPGARAPRRGSALPHSHSTSLRSAPHKKSYRSRTKDQKQEQAIKSKSKSKSKRSRARARASDQEQEQEQEQTIKYESKSKDKRSRAIDKYCPVPGELRHRQVAVLSGAPDWLADGTAVTGRVATVSEVFYLLILLGPFFALTTATGGQVYNVTAEHGDFTHAELDPAAYDAALAVFAFSAMSDVPTAVSIAHHALRPGGRLFVVDLRRVPHGRAAPLIHLARLTYRAPSRAGPAPTSSTPSPPRPSPRNHVWPASMPWMSPLGPTAAWMVGK